MSVYIPSIYLAWSFVGYLRMSADTLLGFHIGYNCIVSISSPNYYQIIRDRQRFCISITDNTKSG